MKVNKLSTGYLIVDSYSKGELETLSIGDYGKSQNIRAEFLGFYRRIDGVPNQTPKPLSEKWVITLSTQYGCQMRCVFCDVPKIPFRGNATFDDLRSQLYTALSVGGAKYTDRLNIHFARMGEPIFNPDVFVFARWLAISKKEIQDATGVRIEVIHPVLSTSFPNVMVTAPRIHEWARIKNGSYNGQAGLQISINTTDEEARGRAFNRKSMSLQKISDTVATLPEPIGRKYCLNFAYASGDIIDADKLASMFDPSKFMCKITPIHNNAACRENGIITIDGYKSYTPYADIEQSLINAGFDVLVFIPSLDEERDLITCGNAILAHG